VFQEKRSGRDGKRPELARCIEYVREGDVLLVTKLEAGAVYLRPLRRHRQAKGEERRHLS
jgi:DNA invertase Pin-like site-specific DNA recombinase